MVRRVFFSLAILFDVTVTAQGIKPGFSKEEYAELMAVSARFGDSVYYSRLPQPKRFQEIYTSPVMGLENKWSLWTDGRGTAVINLRGTTQSNVSWLANFYAAMIPAQGRMQLTNEYTFEYSLSRDPKATVHVGWTVAAGFLARDILPRIDSLQRSGTAHFFIMGHSQGGAIAYLLTAYLYSLQRSGRLPQSIRFKTYCSAAPKPGNLFFAYDYEALTQAGWSYTVVNAADWVPESPVSVQTLADFNPVNPFKNVDAILGKGGFIQRVALRHAYNKLRKPTEEAQQNFEKYLGNFAEKQVKKTLPQFVPPAYAPSTYYVRAGNFIVLQPDEAYYKKFPNDPQKIFNHHLHAAYLYLLNQLPVAEGKMF